jgi:pilus assembly protein CpaD
MIMMRSSLVAPVVLAFAATLASCASTPPAPLETYDVSVRYPITVTPGMRTLRLAAVNNGGELDPNMSAQLTAFVSDYKGQGVGALSLSAPRNWEGTARGIADRIVGMGVTPDRILLGTDEAPQPGGEVTLTFIRYVAQSPACGDWSVDLARTFNNRSMPNLGCATQKNLAAMVADPRDLVQPKPMGPADAQRALTILERYRNGEPTQAQQTQEQSGVVSQVGAAN